MRPPPAAADWKRDRVRRVCVRMAREMRVLRLSRLGSGFGNGRAPPERGNSTFSRTSLRASGSSFAAKTAIPSFSVHEVWPIFRRNSATCGLSLMMR